MVPTWMHEIFNQKFTRMIGGTNGVNLRFANHDSNEIIFTINFMLT